MEAPKVSVGIIVMKKGEVLVGQLASGKWALPETPIQPMEHVNDAATRGMFIKTGLAINVKDILFVSEIVKEDDHRIILYLFGGEQPTGELTAGGGFKEVRWLDVRKLGEYQKDMDEATVEAFYKFSLVLRQQGTRQGVQA
jgi:ADP-ribose pyrophosphatase YjhB (NUDIX family)